MDLGLLPQKLDEHLSRTAELCGYQKKLSVIDKYRIRFSLSDGLFEGTSEYRQFGNKVRANEKNADLGEILGSLVYTRFDLQTEEGAEGVAYNMIKSAKDDLRENQKAPKPAQPNRVKRILSP